MNTVLAICLLSLTAVDVDVKTVDDVQVQGELVQLSSDTIVLQTATGEQTFKIHELLSAMPRREAAPKAAPPGDILVELLDGSRIRAVSYEVMKGNALIGLPRGGVVESATRSIKSVLLRPHDEVPDLVGQWSVLRTETAIGDTVVIRKEVEKEVVVDGKTVTKTFLTLAPYVGVINDVTPGEANFKFGEKIIEVKRAKIEGLLYHQRAGRELPEATCHVADLDGSSWHVRSLNLVKDSVELVTSAGVKVSLSLSQIKDFDFSVGNSVYLSDLEPETSRWAAYFGSADQASLAAFYAPRMDESFNGDKLSLFVGNQVKQFDKGVAIHSRTSLIYRLSGKYRHFVTKVGIDPTVRDGGNVKLVISGDGKTIFEAVVTGKDADPLDLDLDIDGVDRLKILVDFGEELDISDHLNLCNAKITK